MAKAPTADIQFVLNVPYTHNGLTLTFVRRTARCIFDSTGRKHVINPWTKTREGQLIEHIKPWGQHAGFFFARTA